MRADVEVEPHLGGRLYEGTLVGRCGLVRHCGVRACVREHKRARKWSNENHEKYKCVTRRI